MVEWPDGFFYSNNLSLPSLTDLVNPVEYFLSRIQHEEGTKPVDNTFPDEHLFVVSVHTPWFIDIANYLATGKLPNHLSPPKKRCIIVQSSNYSWVDNDLFPTSPYLIIRWCVREDEMTKILHAWHDGPCGGNSFDKRTSYKVLNSIYYWPSIFKYASRYVRGCDSFQRMGRPTSSDEMPL